MSVYGDPKEPNLAVRECDSVRPKSFYGVGKLASEHYLDIYKDRGLQTFSLRFFNVYGPGQNMENTRQGMVSIYLAHLLRFSKVEVKGSKTRYRDFIYIDDVVQTDLVKQHEKNGIIDFMKILEDMKEFSSIEFGVDDIVRSGLVKSYLVSKMNLGL